MTQDQQSWLSEYSESYVNSFGTPPMVISHGEGSYVWDLEGNRYLDLLAGIAVTSVGHANPGVLKTLTEQASKVLHVSNLFTTEAQVRLAKKLGDLVREELDDSEISARAFFCNSGTEANEAALKLAQLHKPGGRIIALEGGFHGRTHGALAMTHKPAIREAFAPFGRDVTFVAPTSGAISAAASSDVAAIILEPIQGEAGVRPVSPDVLREARAVADECGALLIVDEVQTGMYRTGRWFAHTEWIQADVITLAKGLGGGVPIGAVIALNDAGSLFYPGSHGTTFGGNPMACAVALEVISQLDEARGEIISTGQWLADQLQAHGLEIRGSGLLLGITVPDAPGLVTRLREAGFIANATGPTTLRICPSLLTTVEELQPFVDVLPALIGGHHD